MSERRTSRLAVTWALALVVFGVAGCDDDKPASPQQPPAAGEVLSDGGFRGLYITGPVTVMPAAPGRLQLVSALPCGDLAAMLASGQWRAVDQMLVPVNEATAFAAGFGFVSAQLLSRDGRLAFVTFAGSDQCSALVTDIPRQKITLSGKGLPGESDGWIGTTGCVSYGEGKDLQVSLFFDTDAKTGGMVRFMLKDNGGGYEVDMKDSSSFSVMLVSHSTSLLRVYGDFYMPALSGKQVSLPADVTTRELGPGEKFAGRATVKRDGPFPSGEITMTGLVDEATGAEVSLSLHFTCRDHKTA